MSKKTKWVWYWGKIWGKLGPMLWKKLKNGHCQVFILHGEYLLKQEEVVVQTPEWRFKANIARNATFEGC